MIPLSRNKCNKAERLKEKKKCNCLSGLLTFIIVTFILVLVYKAFQWLDETPEIDADNLEI